MKDELENFIDQNRSAFDDKEPSEKVWRNIDASVQFQTRRWFNSLLIWRSVAVLFMALSAYLVVTGNRAEGSDHTALKEFKDVEVFYVQQISEKVEMIAAFQKNEGLNGFTHDFQQLEAMYMVLKEEMKSRPSDKVKDALVLNLLVRIDLLNQQLHKLEKEYSTTHEKENEKEV